MPLSVFDITKRALLMCEMGSIAMNEMLPDMMIMHNVLIVSDMSFIVK